MARAALVRWVPLGVAAVHFTAPAAASEPDAGLSFQAPAGCPGRTEFVAAVERRGGSFDAQRGKLRLDVVIAPAGARFTGSLRVERNGILSTPRSVQDSGCAEVVDGLAVVAAIALREQREAESPPTPAAPAPVVAPGSPSSGGSAAAQPEPSRADAAPSNQLAGEPTRLRGTSFGTPVAVDVPAGRLSFPADSSLALFAGVSGGSIPGMLLQRYELRSSLATFVQTPSSATHLLGRVLQVRWSWLEGGVHRSNDGYETRPRAFLAGVNSCSAMTYDTEGLIALACAEFGVGLWFMRQRAPDGGELESEQVGTGTAGLAADLRYHLGRHFQLGLKLGGELNVPFAARRPDGSVLFESNLFGFHALAGFGVSF